MRTTATHGGRGLIALPRWLPRALLLDLVLVVLAVAAVLSAVLAAAKPAPTPAQQAQQTRTDLSAIAARELVVMNRIDYSQVDADLAARAAMVTGGLATSVAAQRSALASSVRAKQTVVSSRALYTAVDSVDVRAGTARIISLLQVTIGTAPRQSTHDERVIADMVRGAKGWLLSDLQIVP